MPYMTLACNSAAGVSGSSHFVDLGDNGSPHLETQFGNLATIATEIAVALDRAEIEIEAVLRCMVILFASFRLTNGW